MPDVLECPACGEALPKPADEPIPDPLGPLLYEGETYDFEKLSFKERKKIRRTVGELVKYEDPNANPDEDWTRDDMRVAFAIVVARREKPEFSLEDGLSLTPADLDPPTKPSKPRVRK